MGYADDAIETRWFPAGMAIVECGEAAAALLLARNGAAVAVNYRSGGAEAEQVVSDIVRAGGKALAVQADVLVESDVERMVNSVSQRLGPVDTLVLNAYIGGPYTPLAQASWDQIAASVDGELKATFNLVPALALELGPAGIWVNAVAPGLTEAGAGAGTPDQIKQMVAARTPLGRYTQPEDIAGAVLLLAQSDRRFATGNVLTVDGGLRLGLM